MTAENGMLHVRIQPTTVDSSDFIKFLKKISVKLQGYKIGLFMDNASIHKARDVKPFYPHLDIETVFNVAYSPDFNPIEAVFSKVKRVFNNSRLNCLVNKKGFNFDEEIKKAFKAVKSDHCGACVRKSYHLLEKASI